jgi:hypothetical protein
MASFFAWRLYFLRRLLWQRTASAHRWAVLRKSHGSTALGGVGLGSWVVRWFRLPTAQQLPGLVLLSSGRGIWCGLGGCSVRSTAGPHRPVSRPALPHTHHACKACPLAPHSHAHTARAAHTPARSAHTPMRIHREFHKPQQNKCLRGKTMSFFLYGISK